MTAVGKSRCAGPSLGGYRSWYRAIEGPPQARSPEARATSASWYIYLWPYSETRILGTLSFLSLLLVYHYHKNNLRRRLSMWSRKAHMQIPPISFLGGFEILSIKLANLTLLQFSSSEKQKQSGGNNASFTSAVLQITGRACLYNTGTSVQHYSLSEWWIRPPFNSLH